MIIEKLRNYDKKGKSVNILLKNKNFNSNSHEFEGEMVFFYQIRFLILLPRKEYKGVEVEN